ncbi:hypothetical protein TNCT_479971 [Trichonephila clavata]|uniref:Uncharacterized protein n=1 Tax=Trichonephila clavata TaxID=2740835 RepID=A0A8X6H4X3_TRICU|nr:hypothetical protein TNCT_479971 [Trichonephila clavata]
MKVLPFGHLQHYVHFLQEDFAPCHHSWILSLMKIESKNPLQTLPLWSSRSPDLTLSGTMLSSEMFGLFLSNLREMWEIFKWFKIYEAFHDASGTLLKSYLAK